MTKPKSKTPPAVKVFEIHGDLPVAFQPVLQQATAAMHALAPQMVSSYADTVSLATALGICFMRVAAPLAHAARVTLPKDKHTARKKLSHNVLSMSLPEFHAHLLVKMGPDFRLMDMLGPSGFDDLMKRIDRNMLAQMFPGIEVVLGDAKTSKRERGKKAVKDLQDDGVIGKRGGKPAPKTKRPKPASVTPRAPRPAKMPVTPGASRTRR